VVVVSRFWELVMGKRIVIKNKQNDWSAKTSGGLVRYKGEWS